MSSSVFSKIVFIFFVGISIVFLSDAYSKVVIKKSSNKIVYDVTVDGVDFQNVTVNGNSFQKATLKGVDGYSGITSKIGAPEVPVIRFFIMAESDRDLSVQYDASYEKEMNIIKQKLLPVQESLPKIPNARRTFRFDKKVYSENRYLPATPYSITESGSIRGIKRLMVTLNPFQYNPANSSYKVIKKFKIKADNIKVDDTTSNEVFLALVGEVFAESPSLATYIEFKKAQGLIVKKLVVGRDVANNANAIRSAIQSVYRTENLKYLMIVGDAEHVSSKTAGNISGVTDHYYRAIDTDNYDSDINGPDIGVGRITVKNEQELSNVVAKFIKYQNGDFGTEDWLNNISFIATDDRYTVAEGSHNYAINTYTKDRGYIGVFPQNPMMGGDQLYAITHRVSNATVVDTMNLGRTIINYSGHGSETSWAGPTVTQDNVRSLNHNDALPFVISNACITGKFTRDESYGETWIKHPNGAIMFWGSMDSSYWDEDDILEKAMYDSIYKLGDTAFNKITDYSLAEVWKYYGGENRSKYYWETYVTFGDPSISLRTVKSKLVTIVGPETLLFGTTDAEYRLEFSDGSPVVGARATVVDQSSKKIVAAAVSNAEGRLQFALGEMEGDKLLLNIYAPNSKSIHKEIQLVSADRPYFSFSKLQLDGELRNGVYPGEEFSLGFVVKNVSALPSNGGTLIVDRVSGPISVKASKADIPAISAGSSISMSTSSIKLAILESASDGDLISISMKWINRENADGKMTMNLVVKKAALQIVGVDFGNEAVPFVNGPNPGEEGEIFVTVKNVGHDAFTNGVIEGSAQKCIALTSGMIQVDSINPGETKRLPSSLFIAASSDCRSGDLAEVLISGTYKRGCLNQRVAPIVAQFKVGRINEGHYIGSPALAIPDQAQVEYKFVLNESIESIEDILIKIEIDHSYIGDIMLTLRHPSGETILLRDRSGGNTRGLKTSYGILEGDVKLEALKTLLKKSGDGEWALIIADKANGDVGTLNKLDVSVRGYR